MLDLRDKRIVLGLSGGIACYKSAELVRRMIERGATVDVVMTDAATHFITPVTMQALSGRPVFVNAWDARVPNNMAHIDLTLAPTPSWWHPRRLTSWPSWFTGGPTTSFPPYVSRAPAPCWWPLR